MNDEYVNKGRVQASIAWAAVVGLMAVAWVIAIAVPTHWRFAGMFAATSCAMSAFAAVLHIRCYSVRVANLVRAIRAVGDLEQGDRPRPVRNL